MTDDDHHHDEMKAIIKQAIDLLNANPSLAATQYHFQTYVQPYINQRQSEVSKKLRNIKRKRKRKSKINK